MRREKVLNQANKQAALYLVYMWVKQGHINKREFYSLIDLIFEHFA